MKVYYEQSYFLSFQDKKWFGRVIELFSQMNEQSIRSWIKVAKKLISQSKRKQLKTKQHPIKKYFHQLTSITQPSSPPLQDASDKGNNRISIKGSDLQLNTNERGLSPVLINQQQNIDKSLTVTNSTPSQPNIIHPLSTNITTKETDHVTNYIVPFKIRDLPNEMIPTSLIEYPPPRHLSQRIQVAYKIQCWNTANIMISGIRLDITQVTKPTQQERDPNLYYPLPTQYIQRETTVKL